MAAVRLAEYPGGCQNMLFVWGISGEPGSGRGLDLVEVVIDIPDFVVNVLLLAIRPGPVPNSPL